jgi:hypothetical protein
MMRKPDHEFFWKSAAQRFLGSIAPVALAWSGFRSIYAIVTRRRDTVSGLITLIGTSKENG